MATKSSVFDINETTQKIKNGLTGMYNEITYSLADKFGDKPLSDIKLTKKDISGLIYKAEDLYKDLQPLIHTPLYEDSEITSQYGKYSANQNERDLTMCFLNGVKLGNLASTLSALIDLKDVDDISNYNVPEFIDEQLREPISQLVSSITDGLCPLLKK